MVQAIPQFACWMTRSWSWWQCLLPHRWRRKSAWWLRLLWYLPRRYRLHHLGTRRHEKTNLNRIGQWKRPGARRNACLHSVHRTKAPGLGDDPWKVDTNRRTQPMGNSGHCPNWRYIIRLMWCLLMFLTTTTIVYTTIPSSRMGRWRGVRQS